jgi:glutamate-1-semialdehyde aminotransferase/spore coat polysaccharide biosynthesis protein SpsF (cytidylyltransferase family)
MKTAAIVQARMGSTRFPGKVAKQLGHTSVLGMCIDRLKQSTVIDQIIVATTNNVDDKRVVDIATQNHVPFYLGEQNDVLARYYHCAIEFKVDVIVRITADCPFIDPKLIDEALDLFKNKDLEYFCNQNPVQYPDGLDFDIFTFEILKEAHATAVSKYDREHVTPFIKSIGGLKTEKILIEKDYSKMRWTVDEPEDLEVLNNVMVSIDFTDTFGWRDLVELFEANNDMLTQNLHILNNEGSEMNSGEKLWKRAKRIIPGGNDFFSKRPDLFLPSGWPTYYDKAKGCLIWDMDGNQYLDMSIMGIGTNSLGYSNSIIDNAVIEAVQKSNMSTFNAPEQVYLAERLIEIHPWFEMVKFARTGGEINAVAIRIARAYSGESKVVVCGYHGWHDWYLSTNITDKKSLDNHLLPGLKVAGVPLQLGGLTLPIKYNNFEDLKILETDKDIGVIIMEVMRSEEPAPGYLEKIRKICDQKKIVLIFDECTSGFRETFGGLHKKFEIYPDLSTFGKALGNGYPITALLGKKSVMKFANESFISSTFWSDRVGFVAGLKTLEVMEATESWKIITERGSEMQSIWKNTFSKFPLDFKISGIPALSTFTIMGEFGNALKTYITREFLKHGILASNIFYPSTSHSSENLISYKKVLLEVMESLDFDNLKDLGFDEANTGFARLN